MIRDNSLKFVSSVFHNGTRIYADATDLRGLFLIKWHICYKAIIIVLLSLSFNQTCYSQWEKFSFSAEVSPLLLYKYDQYDNVHYYNKYNYLIGLSASAYIIDGKIDLVFNTGLFLKTKNYYSENWDMKIFWPDEPIKSLNKYTYLSLPLTLKCEFNIGKNYLTYAEGGILINRIISKYFYMERPDGTFIDQYPSDAGFQYLNELYFAVGIGRKFQGAKSLIGIKPYLLYKYKEESYYSHGLYNLGRLGVGVSFYYSIYVKRKAD
jgi:hypothetical protein